MIPADFSVHIEDASLAWQDVTEKLRSLTDGTSSEADVIPTVTLVFAVDVDAEFTTLLNPQLNRHRARIRITDGDLVTYYLLEKQSGQVVKNVRYPTVSGRAYAGILDNWRPVSHDWPMDMAASSIAAQVAHQDVTNQAGATVGVIWQATLDPTIPGGRYSVSKKRRREIIAEIAEACAAAVRCSADGLSLEVYDRPSRALSESAERNYANALELSYECERVDEPGNAIRVQGEVIETTRPTLPVVSVQVIPGAIDADGSSQATARARVFDATGRPVQHKAIVDEPITAGSYTEIPVSGCYSVQGVWLNTGTQENPVKGAKVVPVSFDADTITVPDNGTQLFIVSYTQATEVSWSSALVVNEIRGEAQTTTGALSVSTDHPIGSVRGVYRASDVNRTGTNFFTGGSATPNTTSITLGISPGAAGTAVIIDYDEYEASASVNISPSSSLCDADGFAETTVGAGTTVGMVYVIASAFGQQGRVPLSLAGSAVGSLQAKADPATVRAKQTDRPVNTYYEDEAQQVQSTTANGYTEYFIEVDNQVSTVLEVRIGAGTAGVQRWENGETSYKVFLLGTWTPGSWAAIDYYGREVIDEQDQESTITAIVKKADGDPVTDGTKVSFILLGNANGATLSSEDEVTSGGEASVTLTAGGVAEFFVRVVAGPFFVLLAISVVDHPLEDEQNPDGVSYVDGSYSQGFDFEKDDDEDELEEGEYRKGGLICKLVRQDEGEDGSIYGCRRAVDCDGNPIAYADVVINGGGQNGGELSTTDAKGWFCFHLGNEGANTAEINGVEASFSIDPAGSESRGNSYYEVCRDDPNA